jgi:general L-amino acid transport system ATP-binding protein
MSITLHPAPTTDGALPALSLKEVSKWFGSFQALFKVSLDVQKAERIVICGPSGSGKSTAIRCINMLENFEEGTIRFGNIELPAPSKQVAEMRKRVGMVFQNFNLFPHLTVLENCVVAPVWAHKIPRKLAIERALFYLNKVRISEHANKYASQLSGGQQQRAAIARALCTEPEVMLFDEPTSALDPEMVKEVLDTIMALAEDGKTMICVTHEMSFARRLADRMVFMDRGRIVEVAATAAFFGSPLHERTRLFLSQMQS